ncbi:MAG TPA: hypothetical protein VHZ56_08790 [Devosia sp.]|jgi:hypothetical protein|nr:hypothetical protein [Devosia sp.]
MTTQIEAKDEITDDGIAEFLSLARSANIFFEIVNDRMTVAAVNPNWEMWRPIRHLLDEIGQARIELYMRRSTAARHTVH